MKKVCLSIITLLFFAAGSLAQTVVVAGADAATTAGNPYTTLKAAFDNINLGAQTGNTIVITVTGVTVETATAYLNGNAFPWTSLTIIPAGAAQVTGNIAGALVTLGGADNVTIDGLNAGGNSLAINNSNAGNNSSTIQFLNDANNNILTKVNLLGSAGSATGTGFGVVHFSTGSVTGNDNNTITQCTISASSGGTPLNGIYSLGSSAAVDNSNNTISVNNINDYFNAGAASNGMNINSGNSGWTITNNTFYQTATRIATTGSLHNGIFITSGSGYTISNNVIGFAAPNGTGTTNIIGLSSGSLGGSFPAAFTPGGVSNSTRFAGINCTFTAGGAFSSIQNNTIGGIAIYSSGVSTTLGTLCGIVVQGGNANIGTVTGNTIGSASGTSSLYAANTAAGGVISGIYCTSTNSINIQNNTIGGIDVSGTTGATAAGFKGIEAAGTGTYSISNNNVGNATPNNIRTGFLLTGGNLSNAATTPTGASGVSAIQGIVNTSAGSTLNITNNIVHGIQVSGTATTYNGITNGGAITGTINLNNNQLGNIDAGAVRFMFATSGTIQGILNSGAASTSTINMNNNTIDDIVAVTSAQATLIWNFANSAVAINMKNNQLGGLGTGKLITYSGAQGSLIYGFANGGGTGTCVLTIQANDIRGINYQVTSGQQLRLIYNDRSVLSTNFLDNTFTNLSINNSGFNFLMMNNVSMPSGASFNCNNNQIVGVFNKTASGGQVSFLYSSGNSVTGSAVTATGNNFSNITLTGTTPLFGWDEEQGLSGVNGPTKTITGNTFNNITMGATGLAAVIYIWKGVNINCSSNTVSNVSGPAIFAFNNETTGTGGAWTFSSNSVFNLNSTGDITALLGGTGVTSFNISNNTIYNLSSSGASAIVTGIDGSAVTANISDNLIYGLSGSGTTSPSVNGILVKGGTTVNVFRNKLYDMAATGAISTTSPAVNGMVFSGGTTVTAYNNFISDLKAPNANLTDAVRGIAITSTTASSTYNLYYNSIYLNASSAGTNFGTSGIYHTANATASTAALNMIDNIVVNTSGASGTGLTAAYRRSGTALDNFASTSDYNLLYTGTPSPTRLIYYDGTNSDQTLAAYQARVSTRDANSISLMPAFTSVTDLHLTAANCQIDGKGTPIGAVTDDIDLAARNATTPDIGADEFTAAAVTTLAGVAGAPVCEDRTISGSTTYISNACGLIATVLPSGGTPVGSKVNVCVTLDATQQIFNGEPFVQRHFDIEPSVNPSTATATVTLYFTDAEFALYNSNNPAWPPLPTNGAGNTVANRNNVKITQFHGAATTNPSSPGNYPGLRELIVPGAANVIWNGIYWAVTFDVTGFSGFYVHTNNFNAPLPITVNYLTGRRQGSNHLLNWKVTCNSTPRVTMTLERSDDSRNFFGINSINADAARCNAPFDYTDANPLKGINYYRLKMVDADGHITYSSTVALLNAVKGFDIISIAPNPVVADKLNLNVASAQPGKIELFIFDIQGRLLRTQNISAIAGFNSLPVNVASLPAGTYSIRTGMEGGQFKTMRFVKQ